MNTHELYEAEQKLVIYWNDPGEIPEITPAIAGQIAKELCTELIETANIPFGLKILDDFNMFGSHNDDREDINEWYEVAQHFGFLQDYLMTYCFRVPRADGGIKNGCFVAFGEIISRYNPVTNEIDAIAPYYLDVDSNVIDTKTGKMLYRYDEKSDKHIPIEGAGGEEQIAPPEPGDRSHFNGLWEIKIYKRIFNNLIQAQFLHPKSDLNTWLFICGAKKKSPAKAEPLQWCEDVGLLGILIKKLFDNTPYKWQIAAKVFINRNREPIKPDTLRSLQTQFKAFERDRPKRYVELIKAIEI